MNNEEKIIEILTAMQADINDLKAGQAETNTRLETLEAKVGEVESVAQATHDNLARLENQYQQDRGGLFDGLNLIRDKTDRIETKLDKTESRLDLHELHIRALERPLRY